MSPHFPTLSIYSKFTHSLTHSTQSLPTSLTLVILLNISPRSTHSTQSLPHGEFIGVALNNNHARHNFGDHNIA